MLVQGCRHRATSVDSQNKPARKGRDQTGQTDQGKQNRTDRTGLLEQDGQDSTARTRQSEQDSWDKTARKREPEQNSQNEGSRTGQEEEGIENSTVRQDAKTWLLGQDSQSKFCSDKALILSMVQFRSC
jgi:hypothetical protein